MDQSCSESDLSMSPSQLLERLQALRQLQLLQRGKLQKQRLKYDETAETSSSITEIVSQFSNTTSYNTFRSLLQSSHDTSLDGTPRSNNDSNISKVKDQDLVEGVAVLNLSQESEFVITSPVSSTNRVSTAREKACYKGSPPLNRNLENKLVLKKGISLDEMPILSPKQDFEALLLEKLKNEIPPKRKSPKNNKKLSGPSKKPYLRRGEGMNRFGIQKKDLVIQNTKSLPWKSKNFTADIQSRLAKALPIKRTLKNKEVKILTSDSQNCNSKKIETSPKEIAKSKTQPNKPIEKQEIIDSSQCDIHGTKKNSPLIQIDRKQNHPVPNKGKTWAAILTKEQDDFLRKLKQSDYYKNFASPAKSTISEVSCDENFSKLRQERECAEQNMFELLENKVSNDSFNIESSFFNRFLKQNNLECSGESTPLVLKRCLENNPELMHILPGMTRKPRNSSLQSDAETCNSDCTECCSEDGSASCCCSDKTELTINSNADTQIKSNNTKKTTKQNDKPQKSEVEKNIKSHNDTVTESDEMKANMAEMNAKLVATSELLKERLHELEDEIETFRKENTNLAKLREEVDLERKKFYEEKNAFEQKFNEDKILSEYYLAEEKEKLSKQKQIYERHVREMRGRLNKKEKDEVLNLKKEISDLREEIRIKDAKSTSTIARLRNQIKIMDKEKKSFQDEIEKLKKENRRIQHSNDITRRLTNMKYLQDINKKLQNMSTKETRSEVSLDNDVKYKAFEIERQSRIRRVQPTDKMLIRPRAKSVPNLKVTSRYAKYFSQRDASSEINRDFSVPNINDYNSDNDMSQENEEDLNYADSVKDKNTDSESESENHLEKIYLERFQSASPVSNESAINNSKKTTVTAEIHKYQQNPDPFFIRKSNSFSSRDSRSSNNSPSNQCANSQTNGSKSPVSILSNRTGGQKSPSNCRDTLSNFGDTRPKSPVSIMGSRSSNSRLATVIEQDHRNKLMNVSPEPTSSKSNLLKTNLNPTEIKKSDGSRELRFPNGNVKYISADEKYTKFVYYNGDVKENFYTEGRIKYFYAEAKTYHTTHADGLEILEFPDGQVEKRYKDGSSEIRLPNGSVRYHDPKNEHVREEWRFPDGTALTVAADGERRVVFPNGQVEVHNKDHKRREFPDGTVKLVYNDGSAETRYASGRVRVRDRRGNLIMDSAPG